MHLADRDLGRLLLSLLSKCAVWDEDASIAVDPSVIVDDEGRTSFGVAYALALAACGAVVGVVTCDHPADTMSVRSVDGGVAVRLKLISEPGDLPRLHRERFSRESISEQDFFLVAEHAFPNLRFAGGLSFGLFDGGFALRDVVVQHLAALNDRFDYLHSSECGDSRKISTRLGISVSREGNTRSSERLMALRDVGFNGSTYRCEWHSKIEPHRNRIHFFPGLSDEGEILIGIFTSHLPT